MNTISFEALGQVVKIEAEKRYIIAGELPGAVVQVHALELAQKGLPL